MRLLLLRMKTGADVIAAPVSVVRAGAGAVRCVCVLTQVWTDSDLDPRPRIRLEGAQQAEVGGVARTHPPPHGAGLGAGLAPLEC